MEPTEGSAAPESTTPPAAVEAPAPPKQVSPPAHAPIPGTKYVLNQKTGLYDVHRVDDEGHERVEKGEDDLPEQLRPKADAKPGTADETGGLTLGEHLPPTVRDDPQAPEMLREVSAALDDVKMEPVAKQRLVDLAMELHTADLNVGMPQLWNREANEGVLRQRWGAAYDERVARAQAAAKALGPKFLAWCDRTQVGNSPALLETLALMSDKDKILTLSPEQAAAKMKEWRSDPKSPLRNSLHPEHAVTLAKARVLALLAEGKGRQGNVEEMVADRQERDKQEKDGGLDPATERIDAELRQLRLDPAYFDKSKPNHKAVIERVRELYRLRYPD